MNPKRAEKFRKVIAHRQPNLTVILENVHDSHNIGAVMRSCDSIGIMEMYVLYSAPELNISTLKLGKRTSAGARKWINVHFYTDVEACFAHVRQKYERVLSTHLAEDSRDLYELDLTASTALLFGNESDGVSKEALAHSDGNFTIPQIGMVQSLNISVACAVSLYEAYRQRKVKGFYDENPLLNEAQQQDLYDDFLNRHKTQFNNHQVYRNGIVPEKYRKKMK